MIEKRQARSQGGSSAKPYEYPPIPMTSMEALADLVNMVGWGAMLTEVSEGIVALAGHTLSKTDLTHYVGPKEEMEPLVAFATIAKQMMHDEHLRSHVIKAALVRWEQSGRGNPNLSKPLFAAQMIPYYVGHTLAGAALNASLGEIDMDHDTRLRLAILGLEDTCALIALWKENAPDTAFADFARDSGLLPPKPKPTQKDIDRIVDAVVSGVLTEEQAEQTLKDLGFGADELRGLSDDLHFLTEDVQDKPDYVPPEPPEPSDWDSEMVDPAHVPDLSALDFNALEAEEIRAAGGEPPGPQFRKYVTRTRFHLGALGLMLELGTIIEFDGTTARLNGMKLHAPDLQQAISSGWLQEIPGAPRTEYLDEDTMVTHIPARR